MAQGYSLHPDGTLAEHTVTNTRAYTEIDGLDDGRSMFAIVSFEGVLNFSAEGRLYYRIGAHLHRYTLLDVDGTLPRSRSTPSRDRLSGEQSYLSPYRYDHEQMHGPVCWSSGR